MPITQILLTANAGGGSPPPTSAADFTIEWWQKVENNSNNARPWSVGLYPTQKLSISYESMLNDYFWINDSYIMTTVQSHIGAGWRHMAYVRSNGVVKGYINGTQYTSNAANTDLITDTTTPFYVGTGETAAGTYKGYITDLHIIKGVAKYTSQFTAPTSFLYTGQTGSVFLLSAVGAGNGIDAVGSKPILGLTGSVTTSSDVPFSTLGPYTQVTNQGGTNIIDFAGANYNSDLLNVKAGWTVSDGAGQTGTVTSDAVDLGGNYIRIGVSFTPVNNITIWTFTQPSMYSYYFDGVSYFNYGPSVDWAMDSP